MSEFVRFDPRTEPWSEYELEDGTVVRVRTTLTVANRTERYDERGNPVYELRTHVAIDVDCPQELRRIVMEGVETRQ